MLNLLLNSSARVPDFKIGKIIAFLLMDGKPFNNEKLKEATITRRCKIISNKTSLWTVLHKTHITDLLIGTFCEAFFFVDDCTDFYVYHLKIQ